MAMAEGPLVSKRVRVKGETVPLPPEIAAAYAWAWQQQHAVMPPHVSLQGAMIAPPPLMPHAVAAAASAAAGFMAPPVMPPPPNHGWGGAGFAWGGWPPNGWGEQLPPPPQLMPQPSPKEVPPPGYVCKRCRRPRHHFVRDCPTNVCNKCGGTGHIATTCKMDTSGMIPPEGYVCHRCGAARSHFISNCPTNICTRCGQGGHIAPNCKGPNAGAHFVPKVCVPVGGAPPHAGYGWTATPPEAAFTRPAGRGGVPATRDATVAPAAPIEHAPSSEDATASMLCQPADNGGDQSHTAAESYPEQAQDGAAAAESTVADPK